MKQKLRDWLPILEDQFKQKYLIQIGQRLGKTPKLCPDLDNIFKAYEMTQPQEVKVVILGLDPYIRGEACGLSFSCNNGSIPPSLRIMFKELLESGAISEKRTNADLTDWAKQGVFLLNTILTTEFGRTLAHEKWGWEKFTGATLQWVAQNNPNSVVFMGWGNNAIASINTYVRPVLGPNKLILTSCHPAAELYGGRNKFTGNRHFIQANDFLKEHGVEPIVW